MATFHVLTLNCWDLYLVSKAREQRIRAIGEHLGQQPQIDVVLLQEMWVAEDRQAVCRLAAKGGLLYAHHYAAGVLGGGLMLLSRHPILETRYMPFTTSGEPIRVTDGDFFAGKGVGWARILHPGGQVDVFNTHLAASYGFQWHGTAKGMSCKIPQDRYASFRCAQILQLASFVRQINPQGERNVVLGGDLNCVPSSLEVEMLRSLLPELTDAWHQCHPGELGATANSPDNTFATTGQGKRAVRIDYVWTSAAVKLAQLSMVKARSGMSYSDHLALEVIVDLAAQKSTREEAVEAATGLAPPSHDGLLRGQVRKAVEVFEVVAGLLNSGVVHLRHSQRSILAISLSLQALGTTSLGIAVGGPWWLPGAAQAVLTVIAVVASFLGPLAFFFGFVLYRMELSGMKEAARMLNDMLN